MNADVLQYYDSLKDKDSEGIRYFFDIIAFNKQSGIQNVFCSVQQSQKKATGAERFKELMDRAESRKYDVVNVKEYSGDGSTVVNNIKFQLTRQGKGKSKNRPTLPAQQGGLGSLGSFEDNLRTFGFEDGLSGMIEASAQKLKNEFVLSQQNESINDLKTKLALLEQKCESYKNETESYKERYKEILEEKKSMERDHKWEVQQLTQKSQLGTMALQAGLGFLASKTPLGGILGDIMGGQMPQQQPAATMDGDDDDDDDIEVQRSVDPSARKYYDYIAGYSAGLPVEDMRKLAAVCQYAASGRNLDALYQHCVEEYQRTKTNTEPNE